MVRVGRDLKDHLVPTALPWTGTSSTRPGCSELHFDAYWAKPWHFFTSPKAPLYKLSGVRSRKYNLPVTPPCWICYSVTFSLCGTHRWYFAVESFRTRCRWHRRCRCVPHHSWVQKKRGKRWSQVRPREQRRALLTHQLPHRIHYGSSVT